MLYLNVLAVENLPNVIEQYKGKVDLPGMLSPLNGPVDSFLGVSEKVLRRIGVFFVIGGVVLSFGHQSSLGTMMLIAPYKLHPLWMTPLSPLLFLLSAMSVGLPMVIFEGTLATYFFNRQSELPLLGGLARIIPIFLGAFLAVRFGDLVWRGALPLAMEGSRQGNAFLVELALFAVPFALLFRRGVRENALGLFLCALSIICGVVAYRFNVFLIGMDMGPSWSYFPSVGEFAVTFGFIAFGVFLYKIAVNYLPILEKQ
jgi:Ni/Fe-hydrogenase subunit HybB-like protein